MLPWQPNQKVTSHKTYKLGRQSKDDHNCQVWLKSVHWLWRKCNLTIFPLQVYGSFLLPWQPNHKADHQTFGYFELSYTKHHLYQIRVLLLQWFWRSCHLKYSFFSYLMLPCQPNEMTTGHQTYKLGKQSSNDHNC